MEELRAAQEAGMVVDRARVASMQGMTERIVRSVGTVDAGKAEHTVNAQAVGGMDWN